MVKPNNPQKNYRPGTMLGNLKGWEKEFEQPTPKSAENRYSFNMPKKPAAPKLKGKMAPPPKAPRTRMSRVK